MTAELTYTGLLQEALRRAKPADQTRREADYIQMLLDVSPPAHLLDVPCGEGRLMFEMAARGYRVTGLDIAPEMIGMARRAATERDLAGSVTLEQRDMRDLPWRDTFDGAYCLWESFGYFDDDGNRAFLSAVAGALKPGARLMFDTHIAESLLPHMFRRDWERIGDDLWIMEEHEYDHTASLVTRRWVTVKAGQIEQRSLTIRLYTYRELVALVKSVGFDVVDDYGWLNLLPYTLASPRLVLVARKAGG
jgi:SAM-dependent methyltransferase